MVRNERWPCYELFREPPLGFAQQPLPWFVLEPAPLTDLHLFYGLAQPHPPATYGNRGIFVPQLAKHPTHNRTAGRTQNHDTMEIA
jgi:hypothetical protein